MADNYKEFDWGDEIENDGKDFFLLPEGEYPFTVESFERGRSKGSEKMPPCNMAILSLCINDQAYVNEYLLLNNKMEWKLCQFFTSIGHRKHGERLKMNWSKVQGASGMCRVKVEDFDKDDGSKGYSNKIDAFLDPNKVPYRKAERLTQSYDPTGGQQEETPRAITSKPQTRSGGWGSWGK